MIHQTKKVLWNLHLRMSMHHGTLKIFLSKPYKNRHVFAFDSVVASVFSNRQQKLKAPRREENIHMRVNLWGLIAKAAVDYLNLPWYEMNG